jgi:predicted metalloendopeptidase
MLALGIRFYDKDYYSSEEKIQKKKISTNNICRMLQLMEKPSQAKASASQILALNLSKPRLDRVEQRRRYNTTNDHCRIQRNDASN